MSTTLGKYTLIRKLAVGGMAEVFLARATGSLGFQKKVVVKRILSQFADDPRFVEMFLVEARLAAELSHPNLVHLFDFGEVDGQYFIAMEYIEGTNLRELNKEHRRVTGPLPLPLVARMVSLAAEGLHAAHELRDEAGNHLNLVHRDISPDNIMVSSAGAVKVVDFGIAKAANQPHLTKSGFIKGKLAYMPPEQLAKEPLDRRSDLFALGIVLFELVTGEMPFDATSEISIIQAIMGSQPLARVAQHRDDVPPQLEAIIARCLEKSPAARYEDCRALQLDLERYLQSCGEPVTTADISAVVRRLFPARHEIPDVPTKPALRRPSDEDAKEPKRAALSRTAVNRRTVAVSLVALAAVASGSFLVGARLLARVEEPAPLAAVDAGVALRPAVVIDAPAVVDAGLATEPDSAEPVAEAPDDAPTPEPAHRPARLELRIRPYATVYVDGKLMGDTPLKSMSLPPGKHLLRLVNPQLKKDVQVSLTLKPGENVYRHNLQD